MSDKSFIEYENAQLTNLERSFTPAQQIQYSQEVEYIRYLLKLLGKTDAEATSTKAEAAQKKKDKKKIKDKINFTLNKLVNTFSLSKSRKITHDAVPEEAMIDAKFTKASGKFYKGGKDKADEYLQSEDLADWNIDEELSNDKGLVLHNEKTGKAKIAFRGTDKKNLGDLDADARIYFGSEQNTKHFKEAREQAIATIDKYGLENTSTTGYSLGGAKSWTIGNEFKMDSTGFNS